MKIKRKKKTSLTLRSIKGKIKIVQKDSQQKSYRECSAKDVQDWLPMAFFK